MRIFAAYTESYNSLYSNFFKPSIPSCFEHVGVKLDPQGFTINSKEYFLECIRQKVEHILESLLKTEEANLICWSDIDIEIYSLDEQWIRNHLKKNNAQISFQMTKSGRPNVNTGFFVANPCQTVIALFKETLDILQANKSYNEEAVINKLLLDGFPIAWTHFPTSFFARTQGWPPPSRLNIYHATNVGSCDPIIGKTEQLLNVRNIVRFGWPAQCYYFFKNLPGSIYRKISNSISCSKKHLKRSYYALRNLKTDIH